MKLFNWKWKKNKSKSSKTNLSKSSHVLYNENDTHEANSREEELLVAYDKNVVSDSSTEELIKIKQEKDKVEMSTKTINPRNIYYVSARKNKEGKKIGWEVKKEKAAKITKLCATKEEAITLVKELAGNQGSTCIIRKMDGSIQETIKFDNPKK